jgi:hypothetical protein
MFVFLILGALPLIIYNLSPYLKNSWGNNTLEEIFSRIHYPRYFGNNFEIIPNIMYRLSEIKWIFNNDFNNFVQPHNLLYFPLFLIFFFLNLFFWKKNSLAIRFFYVLTGIMFIQSIFTITTLRIEHFVMFLPLFLSLFSSGLFNLLHNKKLIITLIIIITLLNILTLVSSYAILDEQGGILPEQYGAWLFPTDSVYQLVDYLSINRINPIAIGSGLASNIELLSNYKVISIGCEDTLTYDGCININESNHYIMKVHQITEYNWKVFEDILNENNKTVAIEKIFYTRNRLPEIILFSLREGKDYSDNDKIDKYFNTIREHFESAYTGSN